MQIIGQIIIPNVYSLYPDTMQIYYKQSGGVEEILFEFKAIWILYNSRICHMDSKVKGCTKDKVYLIPAVAIPVQWRPLGSNLSHRIWWPKESIFDFLVMESMIWHKKKTQKKYSCILVFTMKLLVLQLLTRPKYCKRMRVNTGVRWMYKVSIFLCFFSIFDYSIDPLKVFWKLEWNVWICHLK